MDGSRSLAMPANLVAAAREQGRAGWLETVAATVASLERRWSLEVGAPFLPGGQTAWVAPAERNGKAFVVKVLWRHPEAEHEADALRFWDGQGVVRLYDAWEVDAQTTALLLERCMPGSPLEELPAGEQDAVIGGLLRRLWKEPTAGHRFPPLAEMCDLWVDEFRQKAHEGRSPVDAGLAREGMSLFRELPRTARRAVLLFTDLHAGNVLAAQRETWLAIDPKPYVGDPTYDPLQHLLNCTDRLLVDPRRLALSLAALLDLDPERLLLWLFARCVLESPDSPALATPARLLAPR